MNNKLKLLIRGNQINWNQVFYFTEVATYGSIKEAASRLDIKPPTLSEHISQLEKSLNVILFQRQHRKITLTKDGLRLFQHARQMFELGQRMIDVVSPLSLGDYPVSVGLIPSFSLRLTFRIISEFIKASRGVNVKFHNTIYEELEKGLAQSNFDFGFSDRPSEQKDIASQLIFSSPIEFYVTPRLADQPLRKLLEEYPILIYNSELGKEGVVERFFEKTNLQPKSTISSDYPSLLFELCQRGQGVGIFSSYQIKGDKLAKVQTATDLVPPKAELYALWSKTSENSKSVRTLIQVMKRTRQLEMEQHPIDPSL